MAPAVPAVADLEDLVAALLVVAVPVDVGDT